MTEDSLSAGDGPGGGGHVDRSPVAPAGGPDAAGRRHQLRAVRDTQGGDGLPVPGPAGPELAVRLIELTNQAAEAKEACSGFNVQQRWRALVPAGEDPKAHKEAIEAAHVALIDDVLTAQPRVARFVDERGADCEAPGLARLRRRSRSHGMSLDEFSDRLSTGMAEAARGPPLNA